MRILGGVKFTVSRCQSKVCVFFKAAFAQFMNCDLWSTISFLNEKHKSVCCRCQFGITMLTNNHWQMSALPLTRPTQGVNRIYDLSASFWWVNGDDYFVYCLSWFLGFIFFIFWDSDDDLISCCCSSLASKYPRGILYHVVVFLCLKISQSPLDFIIFISKLEKYFKNIPIPLWFCHICFQVGKISQKYPNAFLILSYFVSK